MTYYLTYTNLRLYTHEGTMKVLSLFDGMSCGQLALNRLGIKVDTYYASEIDKYAMQVTQANFPKPYKLEMFVI